ncbi:MAG: hypothetical protein ACUVRA_09415 [Candidatus Bathyarchaeaceae archaeon]
MSWKRILLMLLLFSVLAFSLIYYALSNFLYRLRIDEIPSDAYVVPWMRPNPSIETLKAMMQHWNVDNVMIGALRLNISFSITITIRNETRVVPSSVYLGHDMDYLYIGGKFTGMFTNPASEPNCMLPNYFNILFDVDSDGKLAFPESGSRLSVLVFNDTWMTSGWYHDLLWTTGENEFHHSIWGFAEDYYFPKAQPAMAFGGGFAEYDDLTGTLAIIFSRNLRLPAISEVNALQIRPGERWTLGFLLELGFARYSELSDFVDGWPQKIYPYLSNDSSWWPKLVIDLTNPPPEFKA